MCRSIKPLFNLEPPVTEEEVLAASQQLLRKISGFTYPSKAKKAAYSAAVDDIARIASDFLGSLESTAAPKHRQDAAATAKARAMHRFGA